MLASWCFCLFVIASSCLLKAAFVVFFHPQLHLFPIAHSNREAGIACNTTEFPDGKGPLQYKVVMQKKPATCSITVSVAVDRGTRRPVFVLCAVFLKLRMLDITYKGCAFLNHQV